MCFGRAAAPSQGSSTNQELLPGATADAQHEAHYAAQDAAPPPKPPLARRVLQRVAWNLHYFTFAPIVIMSVLQDLHLLLAALLNTSLAVTMLLLGLLFWRGGFIKVYPKPYDLFNLALYSSMIPLAILQHDWLLHFVGLMTNGGNACFMWATILLPCVDNFVMHSVRDRVPERLTRHPLMRRMTTAISCTWAAALSLMTVGVIIPLAMRLPPKQPSALNIVCSYVLGFGPLLLAFPVQWVLTRHYRKRMRAELQAHHQQQLQVEHEKQEQETQVEQGKGAGKQQGGVHVVAVDGAGGDEQQAQRDQACVGEPKQQGEDLV